MLILKTEKGYKLRRFLKKEGVTEKGRQWTMYFAEIVDNEGIIYTPMVNESLIDTNLENKEVKLIYTIDTRGNIQLNNIEEIKK